MISTYPYFNPILLGVFISAGIAAVFLLFISAPYGKADREGWGPAINQRLGWLLMELPSFVFFGWFYLQGSHRFDVIPLLLGALYMGHYFHRSFIYPFLIRIKPGASEKVLLVIMAVLFNSANGFLNGAYLGEYATQLYDNAWFFDPRFIGGMALFMTGFFINKSSDRILRNLRKPGESGYKIPQGGLYRWVSCPNYLGEILQWGGFALAGWSLPALAFVAFTAANLVPRALTSHRWYREKFADYPPERKAVIPFVL